MSSAQNQVPVLSVECPKCGRENTAGQRFCQFCGNRLPARPSPKPPQGPDSQPLPPPEVTEQLQSSLHAAQNENQSLRQQLAALQEELHRVPVASAAPEPSPGIVAELHTRLNAAEGRAAALEPQLSEWQRRWRAAADKAASLEKELVTKAEQLEAAMAGTSGSKPQSNSPLKMLAAALTLIGGLGGFAGGRYTGGGNQQAQVKQLSSQLGDYKSRVNDLTAQLGAAKNQLSQTATDISAQLDAAKQNASNVSSQLSSSQQAQRATAAKLARARQDLANAQAQLQAAETKQHEAEQLSSQRLAEQQSAEQRIRQFEADIQSRDREISSLRQRAASASTPSSPHRGFLVWSGELSGKRRININNGVANYGRVSGSFPGAPCAISISAPAKIRTIPAKNNNWNKVSFDVSGTGTVQVRINWSLLQ